MKIKTMPCSRTLFSDIKKGEVFLADAPWDISGKKVVFMRIADVIGVSRGMPRNAVDLESGNIYEFKDTVEVILLSDAELVYRTNE